MLDLLGAMAPSARAESSEALRQILFAQPVWREAETIFGFAPLRAEPDWLGPALPATATFAFPRMEERTMTFHQAADLSDWIAGPLGVRQPPVGRRLEACDLILVPGIAFDRKGRRLGRGRGFYDRFLTGNPAFKLGVCFACQLVECVPCEAHDAVMDAVVTEEGWLFTPPDRAGSRQASPPNPPS